MSVPSSGVGLGEGDELEVGPGVLGWGLGLGLLDWELEPGVVDWELGLGLSGWGLDWAASAEGNGTQSTRRPIPAASSRTTNTAPNTKPLRLMLDFPLLFRYLNSRSF
jgi:hypothetical protein